MSGDHEIDFVLRTVEKRDIRFIRLWFTDVLGNLKSFSISSEELEEAMTEACDSVKTVSEVLLIPAPPLRSPGGCPSFSE